MGFMMLRIMANIQIHDVVLFKNNTISCIFSFGNVEKINDMLDHLLLTGLTGVMATIITSSEEQTLKAIKDIVNKLAKDYYASSPSEIQTAMKANARVVLSKEKCGSHQKCYLKDPDINLLKKYQKAAEGMIKVVTVAPELPGGIAFIKEAVAMDIKVAIGHSAADYETTAKAVDAGATIATHLFNAMPSLHHREANILTYILTNRDVTVELIGDCQHVCPEMLSFVFNFYENSQIMLISDSMATTGLADGEYNYYDTTIVKQGDRCNLKSGGFFGGATTLPQILNILIKKTSLPWGLLGTVAWRIPSNVYNLRHHETEVFFDSKMNWICSCLDKSTWFTK